MKILKAKIYFTKSSPASFKALVGRMWPASRSLETPGLHESKQVTLFGSRIKNLNKVQEREIFSTFCNLFYICRTKFKPNLRLMSNMIYKTHKKLTSCDPT